MSTPNTNPKGSMNPDAASRLQESTLNMRRALRGKLNPTAAVPSQPLPPIADPNEPPLEPGTLDESLMRELAPQTYNIPTVQDAEAALNKLNEGSPTMLEVHRANRRLELARLYETQPEQAQRLALQELETPIH